MNVKYIKYEAITAEHTTIAKDFNHIKKWVRSIEVINCALGMDQFQRTLLVMLVKFDFNSENAMKEYEDYKNSIVGPKLSK